MKSVCTSKFFLLASLLIIFVIASAWQLKQTHVQDSTKQSNANNGDTSKPRIGNDNEDEFRTSDMDTAMVQLEIQMKKLNEQMKELDFEKINKQVKEALSKVDFEKIHLETEKALKAVDWKKMQADIDKSLKNVDWQNIKEEVQKSIEVAQAEVAKINMEEIKEQMEKVKEELNSEEFKKNFDEKKLKKEIEESMKGAKESIEKAKENLLNLKEFTNALQQDGLIDKKKSYTIELKHGELYINGNKQTKEITEKFRKYYQDKQDFKIKMNSDSDNKEGESL